MVAEQGASGLVCTFYSYKGGVGRSMALANVAALLSQWGQRVLILDWDLEAPGLERYFGPSLHNSRLYLPGMLDIITAFRANEPLEWQSCVLPAAVPGGGPIHIIHAGRNDKTYLDRLGTIRWDDLFAQGFARYLEKLRGEWKQKYDYVLIDSRTGMTDAGGICSILLPDYLVAMFTTTEQSVLGVKDAMNRARAVQADLPLDRQRLIMIPIAARDESGQEYERAAQWRKRFALELSGFYEDWIDKTETAESVLNYLKIPHVAFWSFGEQLPVLEEDSTNPKTLAYSYALIARLLHGRLDWSEVREGRQSTEAAVQHATQLQSRLVEATKVRTEILAQQNEEASRLFEERDANLKSRFKHLVGIQQRSLRLYTLLTLLIALSAVAICVFVASRYYDFFSPRYSDGAKFAGVAIGYAIVAGMSLCVLRLGIIRRKIERLERERAAYEIRSGNYADLASEVALRTFAAKIETIVEGVRESHPSSTDTSSASASKVSIVGGDLALTANGPTSSLTRAVSTQLTLPKLGGTVEVEKVNSIDIFLSYSRTGITRDWLIEFVPIFTKWLSEMLGRDAVVFDPHHNIVAGENISDVLSSRISVTRAAILIVTRRSIESKYIRNEITVLMENISTERVFPITLERLSPGAMLSELALSKWTDFSDLAYIGEGFTKSERYIDFQDRVRALAESVTTIIRHDTQQ